MYELSAAFLIPQVLKFEILLKKNQGNGVSQIQDSSIHSIKALLPAETYCRGYDLLASPF